ncbi:MAG: helix-turn-helix domain-containing protein [Clostridiales bacterium]|jgi:transcriptional regulator with XRE-family HTH domain|nr:helix-turn-helix domain-containing protein [Clostridiales bacterium]
MEIGEKIKRLRIQMNLTQEELAHRCELSKGFISQLERDLTSPSIATLVDILESLGTNLKDFFNETQAEKIVFGGEDFFVSANDDLKSQVTWIIPNAQKNKMEPIFLTLKPNGRSSLQYPNECEVFGYVLSGKIVLNIGDVRYKAKKGESFYYKANSEHFIENASAAQDAGVIWVCAPPNF